MMLGFVNKVPGACYLGGSLPWHNVLGLDTSCSNTGRMLKNLVDV